MMAAIDKFSLSDWLNKKMKAFGNVMKQIGPDMKKWIGDIWTDAKIALRTGIEEMKQEILNAGGGIAKYFLKGYDAFAERASPSKKWMAVGRDAVESVAGGARQLEPALEKAGASIYGYMDKGMRGKAQLQAGKMAMDVGHLTGAEAFLNKINDLGVDGSASGMNSVRVIQAIVDNVNDITDSLNNIKGAQVKVKLRTLADHLQLGGKNSFLIKNNKLSLKIDVKVAIDAKDLESALLDRPYGRVAEVEFD